MNEVFWENLSWPKARSLAHAVMLDGLRLDGLLEVASLGSYGFHEKNLSRDSKLLPVFQEARAKSPEAYEFEVSFFSKRSLETYIVRSGATLLQD